MKLDAESPCHHNIPIHEHPSKVTNHNDSHLVVPKDNHFMINVFKIDKDVKEGKHGLTSPTEKKTFEDTDPYLYRDRPRQHNYVIMEDSKKDYENEGEFREVPYCTPTAETELLEKEGFYTDKTVTEVELPENIVFAKDGACQIVKDIGIDDGLQSVEKILGENNRVEEKISSSSSHSVENGNSDLAEGMEGIASSHTITVAEKDSPDPLSVGNEDSREKCSLGSLNNKGGDKLDIAELVESNVLDEKVTETQMPPWQELGENLFDVDSSSPECSNDQKESVDRPKLDQGILEEGNCIATAVSPKESNQCNEAKEIPSNGMVHSGLITVMDSGTASVSGRDENAEITDVQQSGQVQTGPGTGEVTHDGATASARSSLAHHIRGDSSFSENAYLSGPIVNSGRIPYSGSISLRSDSSTTSAHSFAFPILHSEWTSSPVKMAKASRRKHRGWRVGLLCCRF